MSKLSRAEQKVKFITGDYNGLKDFAEKEGINYGYLKRYACPEGWTKEREENRNLVCSQIVAESNQKRILTATERQSATLDLCQQIRDKALKILEKTDSGLALNALASACYRLNEVESAILNYKGGTNDSQKEALEEIARAIDEGTRR